MTKYEMLTKALDHLQGVYEGPFLVKGPEEANAFRIAHLHNACRMFGAILEEMIKENEKS